MALFKRKGADPISERARVLNSEIAALENKIKRLNTQLQQKGQPRLRSTAVPRGATINYHSGVEDRAEPQPQDVPPRAEKTSTAPKPAHEPVFEEVARKSLDRRADGTTTAEHFNELGVRKYDLPAMMRRMKNSFKAPAASNPRLVSYLAAGGVQGLRPLRYEKRVARNRFIFLAIVLLAVLIGLVSWFGRKG